MEKKGQNYVALCPFHDDNNPSLSISPSKQIFNCFVCNTGGNAISFVKLYEKKSYYEAAKKIADSINFKHEFFDRAVVKRQVDTSLTPLYNAINDLTSYYEYILLTAEGAKAKDYLHKRGLDDALIKKYKIGYAPENGQETIKFLQAKGHSLKTLEDIGVLSGQLDRAYDKNQGRIMFALNNKDGATVGYSARTLSKDKNVPKYINSPETKLFIKSNTLYNYHNAKDIMNVQYVYLVEGFLDVIALDRAGIKSVVALMGTAFTKEQVSLLRTLNKEVRILLDSDLAGQMAALSVIKMLTAAQINVKIVRPNDENLDPDDLLQKYGSAKLIEVCNTFISNEDFIFNYYKAHNKRDDIASNKKFVNDIMHEIILNLRSQLEVSAFIDRLSAASGFNTIVLTKLYEDLRKRKRAQDHAVTVVKQRLPVRQTLNKVAQAERFIVYQMLVFPEARTFFANNVKVFTHEIHKYIASYLEEFNPVARINYAELLNDVQLRFQDEDKVAEYTKELLKIEPALDTIKYDPDILKDSVRVLNYERELKLLKRAEEDALLKAKDSDAYAIVKAEYVELQRQLAQKYKRK